REPISLGIPVGLLFAARHFRARAALPLAVAVVMTLVFAIGPIFGLPLIARYIRTPAVLLTLFYGLALFGWLSLPRGRERIAWAAGAHPAPHSPDHPLLPGELPALRAPGRLPRPVPEPQLAGVRGGGLLRAVRQPAPGRSPTLGSVLVADNPPTGTQLHFRPR